MGAYGDQQAYEMGQQEKSADDSDATVDSYTGGEYSNDGTGTIDTGQKIPDMPDVPITHSGSDADVSVDTSSLKVFADNLETLADALKDARNRVLNMAPLKPGGGSFTSADDSDDKDKVVFAEADALKAKITGASSGGGLQEAFSLTLHDLRQALMDTADKIRTLANKYATIEEMNDKAGSDLKQLISTASGDLQALQQHSTALSGADSSSSTTTA